MRRIIVDASCVGNAILPDENEKRTAQLLALFAEAELVQPCHWPIEIASLVIKASRRDRLTVSERSEALDAITTLIATAEVEPFTSVTVAFDLAIHHHISIYDAAYLELALRTGLPLLTSDGPLYNAAAKAGVALSELE